MSIWKRWRISKVEDLRALLAASRIGVLDVGRRQHGENHWGRRDGSRADQHGTWRGERVQGAELEDTAASPNKSGSRLSVVADLIRSQREGKETNQQLK
ncbi:unnamed protein product [Prunus armeniaca]|uniref:Uncharacterized protein n=1 Tax=Prunus armeniaca TaxID=36596 RepID=A0A6J5URH8_PRUAR|nr:unnamed protein product [Prunus armeniaca]